MGYGHWFAFLLIAFGCTGIWFAKHHGADYAITVFNTRFLLNKNSINHIISALAIVLLLAEYWRPLGFDRNRVMNLIFVSVICFGLLGVFSLFRTYYSRILGWALENRMLFLVIPATVLMFGVIILKNTGKEFMPALNEGSFLLMPTSLPHAGVAENKRVLQQLDMAVASIPEIETVVGKAGRTESALDPAPLSMYENIIQYKPEFMRNAAGVRQRYAINKNGLFVLKDGNLFHNINTEVDFDAWSQARSGGYTAGKDGSIVTTSNVTRDELIPDEDGEYFRNWRPEIISPDDIWNAIVAVTKLPGVTSAPKLQPIETRLIMLQTGMRATMGIKVKGRHLGEIEAFGIQLENILKQAEGVKEQTVFAERTVENPICSSISNATDWPDMVFPS